MELEVTVVTVCRNAEKDIIKTIESVKEQSFKNFEYIIVDGLSEDSTWKIANDYLPILKSEGIKCKFVSEKDNGIYDAMNKAAKMAGGQFIIYMNAGDVFFDCNVLEKMRYYFIKYNDVGAIYGNNIETDFENSRLNKAKCIDSIKKHMPFCHQAIFTNTSILKNELFDCSYKIVADYEFYLRIYLKGIKFEQVEDLICIYNTCGVSRSNRFETYLEDVKVKKKYGIIKDSLKQKMIDYYYKNAFCSEMPLHKIVNVIQKCRN